MSLLNRYTALSKPMVQMGSVLGSLFGGNSRSVTPSNAMYITTVFSCIRVLAETASSVSLNTYEKIDKGKNKAINHNLYYLLKQSPNPNITSVTWREWIVMDLNLHGNHYSQIIRDGRGDIVSIYPLVSTKMKVTLTKEGKKEYIYDTGAGKVNVNPYEILHIIGLPSGDGITGLSPISYNKKALELGSTAESYGSQFFDNGANATGAFVVPGTLEDKPFQRLKTSLNDAYTGMQNAHKPMLLEGGMTFQQFSLSNTDSQFLETRKYQKEEIASIFRVPMHMINSLENATFSNIEHQSLEFLQFTMLPWFKRIEQMLELSLLARDERDIYSIKFNVDTLLRGDFKTRTEGYKTLALIGALNVNEIRKLENMNSIGSEGDKYYVQLNMTETTTTKGGNK